MGGFNLGHAVLALLATSIYYIAFIVFKMSAARMPGLRGSKPFHVAFHMLTDWVWLVGGLILFVGLAYEVVAFSAMPLSVAQPIFAVSLVLLVLYAVVILGERMTGREWISIALFGVATVLIGLSSGSETGISATDTDTLSEAIASPVKIIAVAGPAVLIAALVWLVGDRRSGGRHARKLAGVAYGIGAGACAGLAEAGILGIAAVYADQQSVLAVVKSPYPYLTIGMAAIALGQLQVALQRCRLAIIASVLTVIGRTQLVISSTVLFGAAWPHDPVPFLLRASGFTLALVALTTFPRHEQPGGADSLESAYAGQRRRGRRAGLRSAA